MDIHPPKHPIVTVRAFLLEIFTVTCGIVIALGLEGGVQYGHARHLRAQTRADFVAEIAHNEDGVRTRLADSAADLAKIGTLLTYGAARLAHQQVAVPHVMMSRNFTLLSSDAWQTALATQGIGQLTHDEVQALSGVYDAQTAYNELQTRELNDWVEIAGYGDGTSETNDEIRLALRQLRVIYALAASVINIEHKLMDTYATADQKMRVATQ